MDPLSYPPEQALEPQSTPKSDIDEPESDADDSERMRITPLYNPPVFLGPSLPDVKPLGETIRIRIDLKGFRVSDTRNMISLEGSDTPGRHFYFVRFFSVISLVVESSYALEGEGLFQGIVQWNETLWIDCPELSCITISVSSDRHEGTVPEYYYYGTELSIADFLAKSQVSCHLSWDARQDDSYLLYTASAVILSDGGHTRTSKYCTNAIIHHEWPEAVSIGPVGALSAGLRRLPHFLELAGLSNTLIYAFMFWMYTTYEMLLTPNSFYDPRIDEWQSAIMETIDAIMRLPWERIQRRREDVQYMVSLLETAAYCMHELLCRVFSPIKYSYTVYISELAGLVHIITAPDPTSGTNSVSASTNQHTVSRAIVKDTLLLALEAIVQSSDAFPPLKSAASGLLFFATYADMASSNKTQIKNIRERVDGLFDSLKHGLADGVSPSPAHREAISVLAKKMEVLQKNMEGVIEERKSFFKKYLRAKRHRDELQNVAGQLDNVRMNYIMAVATLNATTVNELRNDMRALRCVLDARPILASMAHAETAVPLSTTTHIEQVR